MIGSMYTVLIKREVIIAGTRGNGVHKRSKTYRSLLKPTNLVGMRRKKSQGQIGMGQKQSERWGEN